MELHERLRFAIDRKYENLLQFQKAMAGKAKGASYPSILSYLKSSEEGGVTPPLEFLLEAADVLRVRPEWLAVGAGDFVPEGFLSLDEFRQGWLDFLDSLELGTGNRRGERKWALWRFIENLADANHRGPWKESRETFESLVRAAAHFMVKVDRATDEAAALAGGSVLGVSAGPSDPLRYDVVLALFARRVHGL